MQHSQA